MEAEEGVVDRGLRCGERPVDQRVQVVPPAVHGVGEPMTGVPHVGMLTGADLVVDAEDVEVGLGAQVEDAQMPGGEANQTVGGVVGGITSPVGR
jgi:hypothetical protein